MVRHLVAGAVLLACSLSAPAVVAEADERPVPDPPPLIEALAFVPERDAVAGVDFLDWSQLKALHGAADVTGASPLAERQRLLLDIARTEAAPMPFGFDRLPRWSRAWGWDSSDLAWEARVYGEVAIMRFEPLWDAGPFRAALTAFGYRQEAIAGGTVYHPDPAAEVPWQLRFANMHGLDVHGRVITEPMVQVALSDDGRTALFSRVHDDGARLLAALAADPTRVAASAFGRAAVGLGRPLAATILGGARACSDHTVGWLMGPARELAAQVAPLHRYEALAAGYSRPALTAPAEGRYVFAYRRPEQARDDLPGRSTLVRQGYPYNDDTSRYEDVAFGLSGAQVDGSRLILDVEPVGGSPVHVLRQVQISPILFATCGSAAGSVAA